MASKEKAPCIMINDNMLTRYRKRLSLEQLGRLIQLEQDIFHGEKTMEEAMQTAVEEYGKGSFLEMAIEDVSESVEYGKNSYAQSRARNGRGGLKRAFAQVGVSGEQFDKIVKDYRAEHMNDVEINDQLKADYEKRKRDLQVSKEVGIAKDGKKPRSAMWDKMSSQYGATL